MKRALSLAAFGLICALTIIPETAPAASFCNPNNTVCIGKPCDLTNVGMTVLDFDDVNLIACLKSPATPDTGIWKPMTGTTITCPNGELVSGLDHGQPVCSKLTCRVVSNSGVAPSYISTAKCDSEEFVMNGGGYTHPDKCIYLGFLHISMPVDNGWKVDAWGTDSPWGANANMDVCSTAYATCCKWVATSN